MKKTSKKAELPVHLDEAALPKLEQVTGTSRIGVPGGLTGDPDTLPTWP